MSWESHNLQEKESRAVEVRDGAWIGACNEAICRDIEGRTERFRRMWAPRQMGRCIHHRLDASISRRSYGKGELRLLPATVIPLRSCALPPNGWEINLVVTTITFEIMSWGTGLTLTGRRWWLTVDLRSGTQIPISHQAHLLQEFYLSYLLTLPTSITNAWLESWTLTTEVHTCILTL